MILRWEIIWRDFYVTATRTPLFYLPQLLQCKSLLQRLSEPSIESKTQVQMAFNGHGVTYPPLLLCQSFLECFLPVKLQLSALCVGPQSFSIVVSITISHWKEQCWLLSCFDFCIIYVHLFVSFAWNKLKDLNLWIFNLENKCFPNVITYCIPSNYP